jgi:hypothetical protein
MQAEEKLAARSWDDPRLMFPNRRGGAHRRNSVMVIFRHHLDATGLPGYASTTCATRPP